MTGEPAIALFWFVLLRFSVTAGASRTRAAATEKAVLSQYIETLKLENAVHVISLVMDICIKCHCNKSSSG